MSNTSREAIAAQYENNSIYAILSSRGALPGFHWGIFIPVASPEGHVWHATNREGGWKLEHKFSKSVPFSMSLLLARKIGSVDESTWKTCIDVLNAVPAEGQPSPNTHEEFCCRVWVKDAIIALRSNGLIASSEDVSDIEDGLMEKATRFKASVEEGSSLAHVENSAS